MTTRLAREGPLFPEGALRVSRNQAKRYLKFETFWIILFEEIVKDSAEGSLLPGVLLFSRYHVLSHCASRVWLDDKFQSVYCWLWRYYIIWSYTILSWKFIESEININLFIYEHIIAYLKIQRKNQLLSSFVIFQACFISFLCNNKMETNTKYFMLHISLNILNNILFVMLLDTLILLWESQCFIFPTSEATVIVSCIIVIKKMLEKRFLFFGVWNLHKSGDILRR